MEETEFRKVPGLEKLSLSKSGLVIDSVTKAPIEQKFSAGYLCVNIDGVSKHIHRLMAITFLPEPDKPIEELDVNHKDGVKLNNSIENLEWVTRRENNIHAYVTGLRTDNTPILVKDLRTGLITEFYSLWECARALGVNGALIHYYLKNPNKVRKMFFVLVKKGQQWPNLTKDDIVSHYSGAPRVVLGKHLESGVTGIFASVGDAADIIGVKDISLYMHIRRYGEKPYHGYSFRFSNDPELNSQVSKTDRKRVPKPMCSRKPIPIEVKNLDTQQITRWESTEQFAKSVGAKKATIQARVYRTGGEWDKYRITYLG